MSFQTTCPECDSDFTLADTLRGKKFTCKNCGEVFKANPAEDEEEDRPRPKKRKKGKPQGGNKGLMIGAIGGGAALVVGVIVLLVVLAGKKSQNRGPETAEAAKQNSTQPAEDKKANPAGVLPPANPNLLAAYDRRVPAAGAGDWTYVERTIAAPGFAAICAWSQAEDNKTCAVFDLNAGKQLASFKLTGTRVLQKAVLGPKGTYLATETMNKVNEMTFDREITLWAIPEGKAVVTRWRPYPSVPISNPRSAEFRLAWMGFTDADKLLTVTEGGRVGLWSVPDHAPIYDKRPLTPQPTKELTLDVYSWEPKNLALSADRRTLALQQGEGALLVDTATGEPYGSLPAPTELGESPHMHGMAFSPDGTRLACFIQGIVGRLSMQKVLVIWDVRNRKLVGKYRVPDNSSTSVRAAVWWGNNHVYGLSGGLNGLVINADAGKVVRQCLPPPGGHIATGQLDGQLWYSLSANKGDVSLLGYPAPDGVFARDPQPNEGGSYKVIWLTANGVEKQGATRIPKVDFVP